MQDAAVSEYPQKPTSETGPATDGEPAAAEAPVPAAAAGKPAGAEGAKPSFGERIAAFFREELAGWKPWEVVWFSVSCLVILGLSIYWHDTPMGIVSAVTGIAYTLCNGKGKRLAFVFGAVNSLLYAIISLQVPYYGEAILNGLYYFPMMFWGFYVWSRNIDPQTHEVKKLRMTSVQRAGLAGVVVAGTLVFGLVLRWLGGELPFVDAFTTVLSVVAMVVAVKRYMEQWVMWTVVNVVTVVMWAIAFSQGGESIATLVMWSVYLINGIIMYFRWARETRAR